jgi:hypothetical protein
MSGTIDLRSAHFLRNKTRFKLTLKNGTLAEQHGAGIQNREALQKKNGKRVIEEKFVLTSGLS